MTRILFSPLSTAMMGLAMGFALHATAMVYQRPSKDTDIFPEKRAQAYKSDCKALENYRAGDTLVCFVPVYRTENWLLKNSIDWTILQRVRYEVICTLGDDRWKAVAMGVKTDREKQLFMLVRDGKEVWRTEDLCHLYILLGL